MRGESVSRNGQMPKQVPLTQGKFALVSDQVYEQVSQFKWYAQHYRNSWYAARGVTTPRGRSMLTLHRFILGVTDPKIHVDHVDGDGLNCTDENIRLATPEQNKHNQGKQKNNTSGYKGVSWHKQDKKWVCYLYSKGKHLFLGLYDDPEEAARAYDKKAKELQGAFARLNFPDPQLVG
jgi:AP2 domain/HNH endonuclease